MNINRSGAYPGDASHPAGYHADCRKSEKALLQERQELKDKIDAEADFIDYLCDEQHENLPCEDEIREQEFQVRESHQIRLCQINKALERIKSGTFGECVLCSAAIDPRRLNADPAVPLCLSCQEKAEGTFKTHSF